MSAPEQTKQGLVYETVRARLASGLYPPGARLNVAQIARELDVSNIPVREALRRLEAEGWLEHSRNSGMRVADHDAQTWIDLVAPFAVLAGFATAEAQEALQSDGGLDDLRAINARLRAAVDAGDYAAVTQANADFHERIFASTPNPELRRSLSSTWAQMQSMRPSFWAELPERAAEGPQEHDALIELIAMGSERFELEAAVRAHILRTVASNHPATESQLRDRAAATPSATG